MRKLCAALAAVAAVTSHPATACDVALALAVDVSGSVDAEDYRIQMDGLAAGLRDEQVSEALIRGNVAVSLVQWTGRTRQTVAVPWFRVSSPADVEELARRIETTPRAWHMYATAIGESLAFSAATFGEVPDCLRRVIDVSGDGVSNEGTPPDQQRPVLQAADITVNALVIEEEGKDLQTYFEQNVISGFGAFVMTANGFLEYPDRIRQKLRRELALQLSMLDSDRRMFPDM